MKNIRAIFVFLSLVVFLCTSMVLLSPPLLAQSTYGSIAGSVTDSSGAAIADAQVALTNLGTAEKRTQSTGTDGLYSFVNLFPGRYKIEVEKTGFKHFTRPEVVVEVNQSARIDATLQVGDVTQTVEVTGETPLLQTETSSLGQVVEQRKTNELPLNGRNIFNLTAIAPSVIPQGNSYGTPVGKNPFDFANFQVGGSFANQSAEYLDGQPLNIGYINLPLILPTQDSIGEFKVQYNNLGPDWGKFSGGVINLSTKSGNFDFSDQCVSGFTGPGGICADKDASGNFIHQIYDPLTVDSSTKARQPFAGNIIPANRINPTSAFLLGLIPNPTNSATRNNFVKATGLGGDSDEYVPRIDYIINNKSRIFGRYSYWKLADLPRDPFGTG